MRKKQILKIIIPVFIVCVIGGIWFVKNKDEMSTATIIGTEVNTQAVDTTERETLDTLEVTSLDLEELKSHGLPIMIDFGADECIPCKEMAPVLKELHETYQGKVIVKFIDVWKYPELAEQFPLDVIPTQFFFDKEGKPYVPNDPEKMGMQLYEMKDSAIHGYTAHRGGMTKEQIIAVFNELGVKP